MGGYYKTRKHQLLAEGRALGLAIGSKNMKAINSCVRGAALIGAASERDRTLEILKKHGLTDLVNEICSVGVLQVMGYK